MTHIAVQDQVNPNVTNPLIPNGGPHPILDVEDFAEAAFQENRDMDPPNMDENGDHLMGDGHMNRGQPGGGEAPELMDDMVVDDKNPFGLPVGALPYQDLSDPLYDGASISKGKFCLLMSKIKTAHNISAAAMDELYKLMQKTLPEGNQAPKTAYAAKKLISTLGLDYELIHACPYHHILYRGSNKDLTSCPECGESRYHPDSKSPRQVMRYFPLVPRLLLAFQNPVLAKLYQWHNNNQTDGQLSSPVDGKAWKEARAKFPEKMADPRSLGLALAMDGVSPFGGKGHSSPYSIWPVIVNTYNLPPWLATKHEFSWLVMILPGPDQIPQEFVDVYFQPLIDELNQLWSGILAMDGSISPTMVQTFTLHAMLLFTMHDWPGFGYCSGLTVSGLHGCPMCHDNLDSKWEVGLNKTLYGRHRRFLPQGHTLRNDEGHWFGRVEEDGEPIWPNGDDWLNRWEEVENGDIPRKQSGMKRLAIWHELPYWKDLERAHMMDPMHIEANVAKNLLHTILGKEGKDGRAVRLNCEAYNVQPLAWCIPGVSEPPAAPWILSTEERRIFMGRLASMKFPTGYGAGFKYSFSTDMPRGLKSHDYHCLLHHGFPTALRGLLTPLVREAIYRLSAVFRRLCEKQICVADLEGLEVDVAEAICFMEKAFPPSFFVIQTHLVVHLVQEIRLCGPFSPRWMYPWERFMGRLKAHVRNRAHPEASMAEGHLLRESVFYYDSYVAATAGDMVSHSWLETHHRENAIVLQGLGSLYTFQSERERRQAHMYVLQNSSILSAWRDAYKQACDLHMEERRVWRAQYQRARFPLALQTMPPFDTWFANSIEEQRGTPMADDLSWAISRGLTSDPLSYKHMRAGGSHFRTRDYDDTFRATCDSLVTASFSQQSVASRVDQNPIGDMLTYVGYITDIIALTYGHRVRINLLRVQWYRAVVEENTARGLYDLPHNAVRARDESGFQLINTTHLVPVQEEPFSMVEHVTQAVLAPIDELIDDVPGWSLVLPLESRFSYVARMVDTT